MSRTRALMSEVRRSLGETAPQARLAPLPKVQAPPARVYVAARATTSSMAAASAQHTTALLGIGHVGTRYATDVVLQFQAELAVAHAAVAAELPEEWAAQHGFLPLQSQATTHREFLLRPDLGRRLHPDSLARLRKDAQRGCDVQLILADGLSAIACMGSGEQLFAATKAACAARGLTVGTPVCAKFARVWLQDEIGAEVGAKVAIILCGERPGLGTGDGLSAYAVFGPKIGNTDGERNMMSNLHVRGVSPEEAAPRLAALAAAMIAQGVSGVKLDLTGIGAGGREYRAPQVRERLVVRDA
ncbi:MAG: ethanolamine ammonia-lyase subunit EutC [Kofleriaceae bacterium]|nr:ethanolamine ammonia-lyase subunit EutC [Kofleriaceae bacterium]